ncbi:MAG TPA: hypothetical protein VL916_10600, partial [Ilumatobacteraceae bacterium]|nr:hypothetical protein [Ilumatobacteraceae bacterium]
CEGDVARLRVVLAEAGCDVSPDGDDGRLVVRTNSDDERDLAATVNRRAFDAGIVLVELTPVRSSLEDRYLSLVEGASR